MALARALVALASWLSLLGGCAAPRQSGEIVVLPGATERLILAMRMGYAGAGEAVAPARLERAVLDEQLPAGPGASGRRGDWVLENGKVVAVVTAIDGGRRGGRLVDLTRTDARGDALAELELRVLGKPVRYVSSSSGRDETTGSVYVEVSGEVEGAPGLLVSTRYDLAPELSAVVIHTLLRGSDEEQRREPWWIADHARFVGEGRFELGSPPVRAEPTELAPGHAAWFGDASSYVLRPLSTRRLGVEPLPSARAGATARVGLLEPEADEPVLYSRVIAPLKSPDLAELGASLARIEGREPPAAAVEPLLD